MSKNIVNNFPIDKNNKNDIPKINRHSLNFNNLLLLNNNINNSNIHNNSHQHLNLENANNNQFINEDLERKHEGRKKKESLGNEEKAVNIILNNNKILNFTEKDLEKSNKNINENSENNISVDDKVKRIFSYNVCFCRKNEYYNKMQKLIRKDLSIENILRIVNSYEIIKKILIEKQIINRNFNVNFFRKIKSSYSNATKNTNE